jgi:pimeloyl-ACP methyl ester carboxylesterase
MADVSIVPGRTLELPDGRLVRTLESGDLDGPPVVVFHPTPSSRLFVRQQADAALRTGVRLVGFSRPGSGGSTMTTPGLRVVAEDTARVADSYGVERFAVLGFSGGTPFAAATAALFPDRVAGMVLCAAVAPWQEVDDPGVEFDAELQRLLGVAALGDIDAALLGLCSHGERLYGAKLALDDAELATQLAAEAAPPDDVLLTPVLAMGQAITLHDALSDDDEQPAYDSHAFDELAFGAPWDVDVRDVRAPTWVCQGTEDEVTPLAHGRWYAERIAGAELVIRDGHGHLGSFEAHRDEMLMMLRGCLTAQA